MKIVYYFTDAEQAQKNAMPARVERHHVTMVEAIKFNPKTDCELCDIVWIDGDFPKIKEAYESLGVKVEMPDVKKLEPALVKAPAPAEEFDIVKSGQAEAELTQAPRRGSRKG